MLYWKTLAAENVSYQKIVLFKINWANRFSLFSVMEWFRSFLPEYCEGIDLNGQSREITELICYLDDATETTGGAADSVIILTVNSEI